MDDCPVSQTFSTKLNFKIAKFAPIWSLVNYDRSVEEINVFDMQGRLQRQFNMI